MNVSEKDLRVLSEILRLCEKIEKTVTRFGKQYAIFSSDPDYLDSVNMNILQIGEAVGKLSSEFVDRTKNTIDWKAIKATRNLFAHNYGAVDFEMIWATVENDLPVLKAFCLEQIEQAKR